MKNYTESEIARLQENLSLIRKAGGWTAEEFGDMIGVTKQTICNLENKRSTMSKTQYIAIRAVLDYEMSERPNDHILSSAVNVCLNSDNLSEDEIKKAHAFIEGAAKTGLDKVALVGGLAALIGATAAQALIVPVASSAALGAGLWLSKIIKKNKY